MEAIAKLLNMIPTEATLDQWLMWLGTWALERKTSLVVLGVVMGWIIKKTPWTWDDNLWTRFLGLWNQLVGVVTRKVKFDLEKKSSEDSN